MKRRDVSRVLLEITQLVGLPSKVSYAVARTRPQLIKAQSEIQAREKTRFDDVATPYAEGIQALALQHAKRDPDGQPIVAPDRSGYILSDSSTYNAAVKAYGEANADAKAAFEVQNQAFVDWLDEDLVIHRWGSDIALLDEAVDPATREKRALSTNEVILLCELVDFDPPAASPAA